MGLMDYAHPVDDGYVPVINRPETIRGVTISFLILAWIAISLRLFARVKDRLWGWDDLFVFLAGMAVTVGSTLICLLPNAGMGRHFWTLNDEEVLQYFKHVWSTNTIYTGSTTFIKLSILFQYLRVFDLQYRFARQLTWVMVALTAAWGLTFFSLALFSCIPIHKNWDIYADGTCVSWGSKDPDVFFPTWAAHAATNMLLDILVLVLPIPFLRSMAMGGKTRLGLVGLFSIGGVVVTVSIARIISLAVKRAGTVPYLDMTFATPVIYLFSVLEIDIAILCASIPIFWPYVASLASNKILVVNEIEIRTDRRESQGIGLTERGPDTGISFTGFSDLDDSKGRQTNTRQGRLSTFIHGSDLKPSRTTSPMDRSKERTRFGSNGTHGTKHPSSSSVNNKTMGVGIELGHRVSQDSQRNLAQKDSPSAMSFSHASFTGHDTQRNGSVSSHYDDRYVQEWAVPDFDNKSILRGGNETKVRSKNSENPFDNNRSSDQ
ncbi:hypothetical protein K504DRAFT_498217 [Pleomassaria siparia CBS 279.74]|uniref:Rhodopsin domain-containing protein n=1 Tax=Pleomassaria siparia CBS 279.74 TaxID=1314801 RepID=A0A6G1KKS6_9PLEO|nr:hypothetical protein K504DRAFT_498217 [Pleomassaria siparia CBS 279.74]